MKPWAQLPFELIRHAEDHAKGGGDFDRRMALISFDNAIEVSIITYLSLNPIQRDNQQFSKEEVRKWEHDFHSKLRFLEHFVKTVLGQPMAFEPADIIFFHDLRNDLYHRGIGVVPELRHISGIRAVAFWVFSTLFKTDAETLLAQSDEESFISLYDKQVDQSTDKSPAPDISEQTKLLESIISIRHDLNMLMRMKGIETSGDTAQIPTTEAWKTLYASQDEVTANYEEVLERAEATSARMIEDESSEPTDSYMRDLSNDLAEVSRFVNTELRSFQREIVEKALEATSVATANTSDRRVGIVWQTQGSGITASMISYVNAVLKLKTLRNPLIVVASDLNSIVEQAFESFKSSSISVSARAERVSSTSRLLTLLGSKGTQVAFTTIQRLLSVQDAGPFERDDILFVGYNLHSTNSIIHKVFPNALFILFTNNFLPTAEASSTYGSLIAKYDLRRAIEDKVASDINYESRSIDIDFPTRLMEEDPSNEGFATSITSLNYVHAVAADLILHYGARSSETKQKALVVTPSLNISDALFSRICSLKPDWCTGQTIYTISAAIEHNQRDSLLRQFMDPEDQFKIAIVSSSFLSAIQAQNVKTIYVLGSLSKNALARAIGMASRGLPTENGLIVDYGNNLKAIQQLNAFGS